MSNKNYKEHGNALFLILIAVALFAALSYAVTQSGGGGGTIDKEQNLLNAAQITQYAASIQTAVMRMKLTGTADTDISFANNVVAGYEHATPQPSSNQVFALNGGGAKYVPPKPEWLDSTQSAQTLYGENYVPRHTCIQGIGSAEVANCHSDGIDNEDLILFIPYITKELCIELNNKLGVTNPSGNPPVEFANAWPVGSAKFQGSYTSFNKLNQDNQYHGCFEGDGAFVPPAGTYHYFHVLLAR